MKKYLVTARPGPLIILQEEIIAIDKRTAINLFKIKQGIRFGHYITAEPK